MAFSLVKGSIHLALDVFDVELNHAARGNLFKDKNGVVVSLPVEHGIRYINALKSSRTVLVEGDEHKNLTFTFSDDNEIKGGQTIHYFRCAYYTEQVLNFLIGGTLVEVKESIF